MKRFFTLILTLALLLSCLPGFAARGESTLPEETIKELNGWFDKMYQKKIPVVKGDPMYLPRLVFAIYEDKFDREPQTSLENQWRREYFSDISSAWLASSLEEANTLVLIYGTYKTLDAAQGGGTRTYTRVAVVDLTSKKMYASFVVCYEDPEKADDASEEAGQRKGAFSPEKAVQAVADKLENLNPYADKERYDEAMKLYKAQKYYSAKEAFEDSEWGDWEKKAKACVKKFPGNKQIWRNKSAKGTGVQLTFHAKGIPSSTGTVLMFYNKAGKALAYLFIRGGSKATVKLPTGAIMIKMGIGKTWYGVKELFGPDGDYLTMLVNGQKYTTLRRGRYTLTCNVSDGNVGSESESWNSVKQ